MPGPRALLAAASAPCRGATTRTCVYAMDGANGSNRATSSVFMFDPKTQTWSSVTPAPPDNEAVSATSGPCLINVRNTCIYMGSGIDTSLLDMYDPRTNIWLGVAPSLTRTPAVTSGPCSNDPSRSCIWLTGGLGVGHNRLPKAESAVQEFDPANDDGNGIPIVLPPLRRSRSGDGAASGPCTGAPGNCLYTVNGGSYSEFEGGFDPAQSLEMARPVRFNGPTFGTGAVTKNKGKGTAAIAVDFDGAGLVRLTGIGVESVFKLVPRPGVVQLVVRATGQKASILSRKHQVTVTVTIDFSATAEPDHTVSRTITLQRSKSSWGPTPPSQDSLGVRAIHVLEAVLCRANNEYVFPCHSRAAARRGGPTG